MPKNDHSDEALRVYDSRTLDGGFWHPGHSDLMGPKGWEFLPSGDERKNPLSHVEDSAARRGRD